MFRLREETGPERSLLVTAGQISDYIGATAPLNYLPKAQWLLADRCPTAFFSAIAPRCDRHLLTLISES